MPQQQEISACRIRCTEHTVCTCSDYAVCYVNTRCALGAFMPCHMPYIGRMMYLVVNELLQLSARIRVVLMFANRWHMMCCIMAVLCSTVVANRGTIYMRGPVLRHTSANWLTGYSMVGGHCSTRKATKPCCQLQRLQGDCVRCRCTLPQQFRLRITLTCQKLSIISMINPNMGMAVHYCSTAVVLLHCALAVKNVAVLEGA
jgi:hypothetical protein